jgi:hypothetical protein
MSDHERHIANVVKFPRERVTQVEQEKLPIVWDPDEVTNILSGRRYTSLDDEGSIDECKIFLPKAGRIQESGELAVPFLLVRPADNYIHVENGIGNSGYYLSNVHTIEAMEEDPDSVLIRAKNELEEIEMQLTQYGTVDISHITFEQENPPDFSGRVYREIERLGDIFLGASQKVPETGYNKIIQLCPDKK